MWTPLNDPLRRCSARAVAAARGEGEGEAGGGVKAGFFGEVTARPREPRTKVHHSMLPMGYSGGGAIQIATHNEPHGEWRRYRLQPNEEEMLRAVGRASQVTSCRVGSITTFSGIQLLTIC